MRHLPEDPSASALIFGAGASLVLLLGMMLLDQALRTPAAPHGIVSFELAGSLTAAQRILASWHVAARIQAGISLGLDFSFLAAYAFTLSGASRKVAVHLPASWEWFSAMGRILSKAAWLAGGLDTVENLALIQILIGPGRAWQAALAAGCAWPKFVLTAAILLYIGFGGAVIVLQKQRLHNSS